MKIALVHDALREYGGAERVLEALHEMFPDAPVFVAVYDPVLLGRYASRFAGWDIRQTAIARFPLVRQLFSPYRIFAAWAFSRLDLSAYDAVISSTNMYMAKAVRVRPGARHLSYVHTPPRSLYGYTTRTNWRQSAWTRIPGELINFWMRFVDFRTAQRPTTLIANSRTTQERITKFYRRSSIVVPPPVNLVEHFTTALSKSERTYLLYVNRLVHSKHPEVAVAAANALQLPLKVVGVGPMLDHLRSVAGPTVEFLGAANDAQLAEAYAHAQCVLYPVEDEDFGMVPVEAMAAGTPVVAHRSGEPQFVVGTANGVLVSSLDRDDWAAAIRKTLKKSWNYEHIRQNAQPYGRAAFVRSMRELLAR